MYVLALIPLNFEKEPLSYQRRRFGLGEEKKGWFGLVDVILIIVALNCVRWNVKWLSLIVLLRILKENICLPF